jgi:hypothetical protein
MCIWVVVNVETGRIEMQLFLRTAFALVVLTTFANGAYAGPASESQAIQGDEGKSNPPVDEGKY